MIKVEESHVKLEGKKTTLLSEFTILIKGLYDAGVEEKLIRDAMDVAFMDEEELSKTLIKELEKFVGNLESMVKEQTEKKENQGKRKTRKNKKDK